MRRPVPALRLAHLDAVPTRVTVASALRTVVRETAHRAAMHKHSVDVSGPVHSDFDLLTVDRIRAGGITKLSIERLLFSIRVMCTPRRIVARLTTKVDSVVPHRIFVGQDVRMAVLQCQDRGTTIFSACQS